MWQWYESTPMARALWPILPSTDTRVVSVALRVKVLRSTHNFPLVLDVAGTPRLALVLDVAGSPAFPPRYLLLHSIATFALMIAVLAPGPGPLTLALAVAAQTRSAACVRDDEIDLGFLAFALLWYSTSCSSPRRSPRRREGARGAARSSGSAACPCQRR